MDLLGYLYIPRFRTVLSGKFAVRMPTAAQDEIVPSFRDEQILKGSAGVRGRFAVSVRSEAAVIRGAKQDGKLAGSAFPLAAVSLLWLLAGCGSSTSQPVVTQPPSSASNPTPAITAISPNSGVADGSSFTLTINGANFVAGSTVNFGGATPATTFVSSAQLTASIPASSLASIGTMAVTVTNPAPGGGTSNSIDFTITSNDGMPTIRSLSPSCDPAGEQVLDGGDLTVSGTNFMASSVVRWNGADRPTTFDSNSGGTILTAQISASDIAAAGTATVTVFNPPPGGGSSNSTTFTITAGAFDPQSIAVAATGKFAYVANLAGCPGGYLSYVSMYTIDPSAGTLTPIGPPASVNDDNADFMTVDPSGKFAYVTTSGDWDTSDGSISAFTINPTNGVLTYTGAVDGNSPNFCCFASVAVDPSGKFAYVADGGGGETGVSMYTINATTGALSSIGKVGTGGIPRSLAVHPSGKFAYVADENAPPGSAGTVSMYTIDATTGVLTSAGTIATGADPVCVVVDPTGKFAYVANASSNNVSMYNIDGTTGDLMSVGTVAAGTQPSSLAVDPSGKFVYVTNFVSNDVWMYTIDGTTGTLTPIGTMAAGQYPTSIAVHPSGKFTYVTNSGDNDVSMYGIDPTSGILTLIGTAGT
jgi:6-phosphogluconolactonase (cycloisomerase 2 family)